MSITARFRAAAALGFLAATAFDAAGDDWPQWRGPNRDGISKEKGWSAEWPGNGPKRLWEANLGEGCSSISVAEGRAYTMGFKADADHVYCLDAATGKVIWEAAYPATLDPKMFEGGPTSTPVVSDGLVYTVSRTGDLHCFDAATGKKIWATSWRKEFMAKPPDWGYAGSPLILKDWLIAEPGAHGASIVAYDRKTGRLAWKSGDFGAAYSSPITLERAGRTCLATFNQHGLCLWEAADGRPIWDMRWTTSYDVNAATPIHDSGRIFISSGYGSGCALVDVAKDPPSVAWQNKDMRNKHNVCVLWEGHLFGFDETDLVCMEFATGIPKWKERGLGRGALMLADGRLIIQAERGELVIARASPQRFERVASARAVGERAWVMPVLANGRIYCRSNRGSVACLDVAGP